MKKLTAVLLLFAVLFSVTACGKVYFDEDEYLSEVSKEESEAAVSSSKQEEEISQNKEEVADKIGKTEENKKIVVKETYGNSVNYVVTYFKNGIASYRDTYTYFDTKKYYEKILSNGDDGNDKIIDHDDNLRLIVYRNKEIVEGDFEMFLSLYERRDAEICEIIQ